MIEVSISKACGHVRDSAINVVAGGLIRGPFYQSSRSASDVHQRDSKSQFERVGENSILRRADLREEAEGSWRQRYWIRRVLVRRGSADKNGEFAWVLTPQKGQLRE